MFGKKKRLHPEDIPDGYAIRTRADHYGNTFTITVYLNNTVVASKNQCTNYERAHRWAEKKLVEHVRATNGRAVVHNG